MSNSSPIRNGIILPLASLLYACQLGPPAKEYSEEYLVQSGDVPAVRVFGTKPNLSTLEHNPYEHNPYLDIFSGQDTKGSPYVVLCEKTRFAKTVNCYHYDPSTRTAHRLPVTDETGVSKLGLQGDTRYAPEHKKVRDAFRVEKNDTYFEKRNTLWFGDKQVSPVTGKKVVDVILSPDAKTASILSTDAEIYNPAPMPAPLMFLPPFRENTRTPKFQHYHQFYYMDSGTLSKPVRLPLAINGYPMMGKWSPDGKYVVYYGGSNFGGMVKPEEGGKYPDYAAIVHLEGRHE